MTKTEILIEWIFGERAAKLAEIKETRRRKRVKRTIRNCQKMKDWLKTHKNYSQLEWVQWHNLEYSGSNPECGLKLRMI